MSEERQRGDGRHSEAPEVQRRHSGRAARRHCGRAQDRTITAIHHDAAIVYAKRPYVLVVLVRGLQDQKQSAALIASISRTVSATPIYRFSTSTGGRR